MSEQEAEIETLMHEATALYGAGRIGMAENAYKAVLKKQRNHPGALHLLGVITCQRGDKERGMRMIERALRVKSPFPDAYNSLATICLNTGDPERAIEMTGRALDQDAANVAALKIRARAQTRLKDIEGAVATYAEIDRIRPDDPVVVANWAQALLSLERFEDAAQLFARAMDLDPTNREAWCYRAQALKGTGRFGDALAMLEALLAEYPDYVPAMIHAGDALQTLGRHDAAIRMFRDAVAAKPDHAEAHFNLGVALLSQGAFHEGWQEYAWRFRMDAYADFRPPIPAPVWTGEPLAEKRILIFAEQGMGDTIQFVRYAGPLAAQGAEVHCLCAEAVAGIVATVDGIAAVHGYGGKVPRFDYQISMMELPHVFDTTPETVPGKDGYIRATKDVFRPGPGFNVGLVWQGNRAHKNDTYRSIPLERFGDLLSVAGATFYGLQLDDDAKRIGELGWDQRIADLSSGISSFADTADIVSKLDLVISVDTSVAHLAGALGTPVWVLLPTVADWRWGRHTDSTCWYNAMRLFRQTSLGEWAPVLSDIKTALVERAGSRTP